MDTTCRETNIHFPVALMVLAYGVGVGVYSVTLPGTVTLPATTPGVRPLPGPAPVRFP